VGANERAIDFPHAVMKDASLDFSFSGLKTAVRRVARERGLIHATATGGEASPEIRDLVASFQRAVVEVLVRRTVRIALREDVRTVFLAGGVACNTRLRGAFREAAQRHGLRVLVPSPQYTTDNAAMIAAAAFVHLDRGRFAGLDLNAEPGLRL